MKLFFAFIISCSLLSSAAQTTQQVYHFKTAVSFNPTVLAATDNMVMIGGEHRLKKRFALVLDAGYIFDSYLSFQEVIKTTTGFTVRPGVRLYNGRDKRGYLELNVFYKQVNYKLYDWLGKDCVNGIETYEQLQKFTYRKKTVSFNFLTGRQFRLSNKLLLDLYGGLGVKIRNQGPAESSSCYRENERRSLLGNRFARHDVLASFPFGVKLLLPVK